MNISEIEINIKNITKSISKESFFFDFLVAYGFPKATISRLKHGNFGNQNKTEIIVRKKVLFKSVSNQKVKNVLDELHKSGNQLKHDPRFIIVTDFHSLCAIDRKTENFMEIPIKDLNLRCDFFLPLAGIESEKLNSEGEEHVGFKAAERISKLYSELRRSNRINSEDDFQALNYFLVRLIFCFFSEDTNIFEDGIFTNSISSHTRADGSDLKKYLDKLFNVLNEVKRDGLPSYLKSFPYVNGRFFQDINNAPSFNKKSRQIIIDLGKLDWSEIQPDILGSMLQSIVSKKNQGQLGAYFTSASNIMKVIGPLFLDDMYGTFEEIKNDADKLEHLLNRLSKITIFDPAYGAGNFLIVVYKELRKFEIKIIRQLVSTSKYRPSYSKITLSQLHGVEREDFASKVSMLGLLLSKHQMDLEFMKAFDLMRPTLPLKELPHIVQGNATRLNWEEVCPKVEGCEVYLLGTPPFKGSRKQSPQEKSDIAFVFKEFGKTKNLDYIACWFYLGSVYIKNSNSKFAFVSTNSISQGEQVGLLWPLLFKQDVHINFAYDSFKWSSGGKGNAGVTVVIIGMQSNSKKSIRKLFTHESARIVDNISPYLTVAPNVMIQKRKSPLSNLPLMPKGNMPYDNGNLIFNAEQKNSLLESYPDASKFLKIVKGSDEFINGKDRWCLWIETEKQLTEVLKIPEIKSRIEAVKKFRLNRNDKGAHKLAERAHQFREMRITQIGKTSIIVPSVSSERREYLPIGFENNRTIITNLAFAIYNAEPWVFGVIISKIHAVWIRAVCGCLETRIRYSSELGYNTFPFPEISDTKKDEISRHVYQIIEERERYSEKTIAFCYDPKKMPSSLKTIHRQLDLVVERCYRPEPFNSDEDRLAYLLKEYQKMTKAHKVAR